ncbi:hypothetical protein B9Z55_018060 [Caenorhabditis nigoni]|nr:hypothetical protein B9Z55_018060 [Caenorhabditis nigoni]
MYQFVFQIIPIFSIIFMCSAGKKSAKSNEKKVLKKAEYATPPTQAPPTSGLSTGTLNESALKPVEKSKVSSKIDNPNSTSAVKNAEGAEPAKKPRHDPETSINTRFEQDKGVQSTSVSVVV